MRLIYIASVAPEEDGGYVARVSDLPGCVTTGRTLAETLDNIRDAAAVYLCSLEDDGVPLPAPRAPESVALEPCAKTYPCPHGWPRWLRRAAELFLGCI